MGSKVGYFTGFCHHPVTTTCVYLDAGISRVCMQLIGNSNTSKCHDNKDYIYVP